VHGEIVIGKHWNLKWFECPEAEFKGLSQVSSIQPKRVEQENKKIFILKVVVLLISPFKA
jgi:hypothetical protein